jgi:hypothetical protein
MKNKLLVMLGLLFASTIGNAIPPGEDYPVNVIDSEGRVVWSGSFDEYKALYDAGQDPCMTHHAIRE